MANEALRRALADRRMTPNDLAGRLAIDPKTVARWLTDEARTPHPRHRWAVAELLEVDEVAIWPQSVRSAMKTGPDREVLAVYPTRSAMPREVRQRMIGSASRELVFAVYTGYSLWADVPDFNSILRAKIGSGARVRFILGDPDSELTRLTDEAERTPLKLAARIGHTLAQLEPLRDVIEVRQTFLCWGKGVTRCDDEAVLTMSVLGRTGTDAPRLHLRRRQDGGLFDRMAVQHAEALWEAARPVRWS